jgi:hypothetical protein
MCSRLLLLFSVGSSVVCRRVVRTQCGLHKDTSLKCQCEAAQRCAVGTPRLLSLTSPPRCIVITRGMGGVVWWSCQHSPLQPPCWLWPCVRWCVVVLVAACDESHFTPLAAARRHHRHRVGTQARVARSDVACMLLSSLLTLCSVPHMAPFAGTTATIATHI